MGLLDGKKALVAGVANKNSIAWGIAKGLHAQGARLAFTCVENNVRRLKKLTPEVDSDIIITCNVRDDEAITRVFQEVHAAFGGTLDILVHSIAYAEMQDLGGEFIRVSRSRWNLAVEISAYSLVAFARCARPLMNAAGGGSIITLTFNGGQKVVPGYNIMGSAKAALDMSVRYLAYDLGPENIRVNAISAGPVSTLSALAIKDVGKAIRLIEETAPLLRNINQEDIGKSAVYLASDLSRSVTGEILLVDAGMNILCPSTQQHPKFKTIKNL